MRMLNLRSSISRCMAMGIFLLLTGAPLAQRALAAKSTESNASVQNLLYQAREEAVGLDNDSEVLESLVRSDADWQGHAEYLNSVAAHINRLGAIVAKLQSDRTDAAPWQQSSIDRVLPMLREIAANTQQAIDYLKRNKSRPVNGDYATWLRENAESAHELTGLISDTIQYGETKDRLDRLAMTLSFPQE